MNPVAEEMLSYLGSADSMNEEDLMHYGMPRRSGRYPWGSGEDPYQHGRDFLGRVDEMRKNNFTYTDENGKKWTGDNAIAKSMGLTSSEYRRQVSWANYKGNLKYEKGLERAREANIKPVRIVETGQVFASLADCAEYLGVARSNISRVLSGERKGQKIHGFTIEYVREEEM